MSYVFLLFVLSFLEFLFFSDIVFFWHVSIEASLFLSPHVFSSIGVAAKDRLDLFASAA